MAEAEEDNFFTKGPTMKDKRLSNSILLLICGALVVILYLFLVFETPDMDTTMTVLSNIAVGIGIIMIVLGTVFISIRKPKPKTTVDVPPRKTECEICGATAEPDETGCCPYCGSKL